MWEWMGHMEPDEHNAMMQRHRNRKDVEFVPFLMRRSSGSIKVEDDGRTARVYIEVAGLGWVIIDGEKKFNPITNRYEWTRASDLKARLEFR